jgi:STE24 endopeptidase
LTALTPALLTSLVFGAALLLNVLVKLWLASRQIRAVARHRGAVPAEFARAIPLAHQRAADYTVARLRFGLLELMLGAAVLLGWTLLGGLDALNGALLDALGPRPLLQPLALLAAFALINGLIELPASAGRPS